MKKWKVVATAVTFGKINREPLKRLEQFGCQVDLNPFGRPLTNNEIIDYASDADAIILGNDKLPGNVITKCRKLKIIAKHGVGVDAIDIKKANEMGIVVTNAPATNNQEVADLAFGFLIMLARGLYQANYDTKAGRWIKPVGTSLYKKTIGIIGVGAIGTAVAKRASGYDMNILGYDMKENPQVMKAGVKYTELNKLLINSDFISLHLPLTESTINIISQNEFKIMKKGAIIINTARSRLIDRASLYSALTDGTLKGYGTDVYDFEPPEFSPIFHLQNVILTPHIGGTTVESNLRMGNTAVDNVIALLKGEAPPNIVPGSEVVVK